MIGTTISHYRILEKLGEGGMGVVYKAQDTKLNRTVALKFLPEHISSSEQDTSRFMQEAQAAASLNHPNICTIHGIEEAEGKNFIVMEFVDGHTLQEKKSSLSTKQALDIGIQIAEGLAAAHEKGIVHRDIKSENVMLAQDGFVKIMDFGLAKLKGKNELTMAGTTLGTAAYMSPEQIRGEEVDQRTDIFSLGVVLYELITGTLPFRGEHIPALMYEVTNVNPRPMKEIRPDVPEPLQHIVDHALEKDSRNRYQHLGEVLWDLKELKKSLELGTTVHIATRKSVPAIILYWSAVATTIVLILGYFLFSRLHTKATDEIPSIALLYLKNLGQESDEPYCYGIIQDLIVDIAKAGLVRVAPMKDILSVQKSDFSIGEIAEQLHVRYVMDGSLKREYGKFRLTAQIVDASTGTTIWADHIETKISEAASLQGQFAQVILNTLQLHPTEAVTKGITKTRATSAEAYEYYVRAGYLFRKKKTKDDVLIARDLYQKAIAIDSTFVSAMNGIGLTYEFVGEYDQARRRYEEALELAQQHGTKLDEAKCLLNLGITQWYLKNYNKAIHFDKQSFAMYSEQGDSLGKSYALRQIGLVNISQGDYKGAIDNYTQSLTIIRQLGGPGMESVLLNNIGIVYSEQGDYAKATEYYRKSLARRRELGDRFGEGQTLINMGEVSRMCGDYLEALSQYRQSVDISRELGDRMNECLATFNVGEVHIAMNNNDTALAYYQRSLAIAHDIGERSVEAYALTNIGRIYSTKGDNLSATRSLEQAINLFQQINEQQNLMWAASWIGLFQLRMGNRESGVKNINRVENILKSGLTSPEYLDVIWNLIQSLSLLGEKQKASEYLKQAHDEIMKRVEKISDNSLRQSYLTNVKTNREIVAAWEQYSAGKK